MTKEEVRQIIREEIESYYERTIFKQDIQIINGRNIQVGRNNGTKIATATDQKIGFYGTTPVVQGSSITAPTGGSVIDTQARTAINSIISRLQALGLIS